MAALIAAQNAMLLKRDADYLDFPRLQIDLVMREGKLEDGKLVVPYKYGDQGWFECLPLAPHYLVSLWNVSMDEGNRERTEKLGGLNHYNWEVVTYFRNKHDDGHEPPWLCFLEGKQSSYPEEILRESHAQVYRRLDMIREDRQSPQTYNVHH